MARRRVVISKKSTIDNSSDDSKSNKNSTNNRNNHHSTQLRWLVNNVEKHFVPTGEVSEPMFKALQQLASAQTPIELQEAGKRLQQEQQQSLGLVYNNNNSSSAGIQERLIKAAAMTGVLTDLAWNWTHMWFLDRNQLPGDICQNALFSQLRQMGRYQELEMLLLQMGHIVVSEYKMEISLSAFNLYLASLSDRAIQNRMGHYRGSGTEEGAVSGESSSSSASSADLLHQGWEWIATGRAQRELGVVPDDVSFATLLEAAAKVGNRTLSDQLWELLSSSNSNYYTNTTAVPRKNINAYNARLKTLVLTSDERSGKQQDDDRMALAVWNELLLDPHVQPDRYSIDLMLLPWVRQERQRHGEKVYWENTTIQSVLNDFCSSNQPDVISSTFEAFLLRLCRDGTTAALMTARAIFHAYIYDKPPLSVAAAPTIIKGAPRRSFRNTTSTTTTNTTTCSSSGRVPPTTRHFNILLEGYRNAIRDHANSGNKKSNSNGNNGGELVLSSTWLDSMGKMERVRLRDEGWTLFRIMQQQLSSQVGLVAPDAVTISTMMGLCSSSLELCRLLGYNSKKKTNTNRNQSSAAPGRGDYEAWLTKPVLLRSAITRFGELGDISSACWLFVTYGATHQAQQQLRLWNVMLGAIAKAAAVATKSNNMSVLCPTVNVSNAMVSMHLGKSINTIALDNCPIATSLAGSTYPESALKLLSLMNNRSMCLRHSTDGTTIAAPQPDSQSYCLVAQAMQQQQRTWTNSETAERVVNLFRSAKAEGIQTDGRFLNALLRCFADQIDVALNAWKSDIRPACLASYRRQEQQNQRDDKQEYGLYQHLTPAYHGLLYCAGRALRPDLAVRLVYAMRKEGLEPDEVALHSYLSGKRERSNLDEPKEGASAANPQDSSAKETDHNSFKTSFLRKVANIAMPRQRPSWGLVAARPYEALLQVECTQYDSSDKRRFQNVTRVRIIV
ncbi:hypothetical protein ACA910_002763 [Epithemia clementina (nom. ined.)]